MTHPDAATESTVAPPHLAGACLLWEIGPSGSACLAGPTPYAGIWPEVLRYTRLAVATLNMSVTIADRTGRELTLDLGIGRSTLRYIVTPAGAYVCPHCQWRPTAGDAAPTCTACATSPAEAARLIDAAEVMYQTARRQFADAAEHERHAESLRRGADKHLAEYQRLKAAAEAIDPAGWAARAEAAAKATAEATAAIGAAN